MEWILTIIQAYINVKAVMVAVVLTQLVKRFLPSVPATNDVPLKWWQKFSVKDGPILTRIIPLLPVLFAFIVTFFLEHDSTYTAEDAVRGIASGGFAGYTYSTTKTMIFGE